MSAIISACGRYRYRLDRDVPGMVGPIVAYFGINPSTADTRTDDATVRKWLGFSYRNRYGRLIVGNPFGYRATNVRDLVSIHDPIGPETDRYLAEIIDEADVLVPCWGSVKKVPLVYRNPIYALRDRLINSGKPVHVFGFTKDGGPRHPLMLGYDTDLVEWTPPA